MKEKMGIVTFMIFAVTFMFLPIKKAQAKEIVLASGRSYHYENLTQNDYIHLPNARFEYVVKISNIMLRRPDGSTTTKYNESISVFCSEGVDYAYQGDEIRFSMKNVKDEGFDFYVDGFDGSESLVDCSIICDISISGPDLTKMKLTKTSISCYLSDVYGKGIKLKNAMGQIKWWISNKKIVSIYKDDDYVTIYPKKIGKCYLNVKCGGKTLKCKITVKGKKNLYAGGILDSYSTRNNVFVMRFKNCSKKNVTIIANDGVAVDSDYKSFDRNVRLKKSISIKPGQVRKLKFYVIGGYTWYNVDDFCINYTVKYSRRKYRMASDTETTWIRKKGKWKYLLTYDMIGNI